MAAHESSHFFIFRMNMLKLITRSFVLWLLYLFICTVAFNFIAFLILEALGTDVVFFYGTYGYPCHNGEADDYTQVASFFMTWEENCSLS